MNKIIFKKMFVYSEISNKYFYRLFGNGVNIIHGKNTSGKSSLIQSFIYVFGINENKSQLQEILDENVFFRLDFELCNDIDNEIISFIRDNGNFIIKRKHKTLRFNGINGNSSAEHIKLKKYINNLFGFSLNLESKNEYKIAPIEALFLPYYISQSVGWVYLHRSFGSFDYYRNFREDFLDYYLGIEDFKDRLEKQKLEKELKNILKEIKFYSNIEKSDIDIITSKLLDEKFKNESRIYIELYKDKQGELIKKDREYLLKCNEKSYYNERKTILSKVKRDILKQNPDKTNEAKISIMHDYFCNIEDTDNEIEKCKNKINDIQSTINSLFKSINILKSEISFNYSVLLKYKEGTITMDSWIDNKVNVRFIDNIAFKLSNLMSDEAIIKGKLKKYRTEDEIKNLREIKNRSFSKYFKSNLKYLNVKELHERRFTQLYDIYAFPSQGVELHKTILSYYFALNKLISKTLNIHRFPFILDAIFKEDIDDDNKPLIVKFISEKKPEDTQIFVSIAQKKDDLSNSIKDYNEEYFNNEANLICIGKGENERSFLVEYNNECDDYLEETLNIINS